MNEYKCVKDFLMDNGELKFTKGTKYTSDREYVDGDGDFVVEFQNDADETHSLSESFMNEHFEEVEDFGLIINIKTKTK
jgi:hypothetical protein